MPLKPLKVVFQMDPMSSINPASDSTFALMREAQTRGHKIFHYLPASLIHENNTLKANVTAVKIKEDKADYYEYGETQSTDLTEFDILFIRQNPPFNMAYITTTYLLETIKDKVFMVNDPTSLRDCSEKLWPATQFAEFMPQTLVSQDPTAIKDFIQTHKEVILKPLYGNAGSHIIHIDDKSKNINALLTMFEDLFQEPIMAQKYLPAIREGDKRIILIDGEFAGALNRIPAKDETRAALALGAKAEKTDLTPREQKICDLLKPELQKHGLFFTGIDIIGDHLTEINVTSPTGIQQINQLNEIRLEEAFWSRLEEKYKLFKAND